MRRLFVATLVASCLATAACAPDYAGTDPYDHEPGSSNENGKADSKDSAKESDGTSASKVVDPPALPDGRVETVASRCDGADVQFSGVRGNGEITRTTREASGFEDVAMKLSGTIISGGGQEVVVQEGSSFRVQVETDANVQDVLTVRTQGDALLIGSTGSLCTNRLRVIVTMPRFHGAVVSGSADFDITKQTGPSDVALDVGGSGGVTFRGSADALTIDVSGSGDVVLERGSATSTTVDVSGSGSVVGKGFEAGRLTKKVSGTGDVEL